MEFELDMLVMSGVALGPIISIIISILKASAKVDGKYIPLINILLGAVAVGAVGLVNQGLEPVQAIIMTLSVVFGSQIFHETFGHALKEVGKLLGESQQQD